MPNQCVAANCTNKRADGFSLFQMPSDENLRAKWIQQIRRTRSGPNGKLWNPTKNSFLCCAHFTEDCFNPVSKLKQQFGIEMKQHKKFLLPGAVPSIFPRARGTESEASTAQPKKRRKSGAVEKRRRIEILGECMNQHQESSADTEERGDGAGSLEESDGGVPVDVNPTELQKLLIRELLRPVAQEQTGQSRTPVTRQTVKEEDDQEKNLCNSENNTTVSQLISNAAAIHTKQEPFDELEKDFVNCCNRNAQLLNDVCGTVGEF
ncbi:PREDICTED: THAP domain-containing protein 4-like [Branchiostoma belcheri]|uniref:THAP domain-containing protein 4-like n=1 Tax=Branchiostoma belcheri TaxID=7741 RepID=A0A6P4ZG14_BRABE|nr:PREDICTED: THAP domain-containing protein 4-like [Branchiostoma belcheri]